MKDVWKTIIPDLLTTPSSALSCNRFFILTLVWPERETGNFLLWYLRFTKLARQYRSISRIAGFCGFHIVLLLRKLHVFNQANVIVNDHSFSFKHLQQITWKLCLIVFLNTVMNNFSNYTVSDYIWKSILLQRTVLVMNNMIFISQLALIWNLPLIEPWMTVIYVLCFSYVLVFLFRSYQCEQCTSVCVKI